MELDDWQALVNKPVFTSDGKDVATLFPKVDQKLLMNMLQFEHRYSDWEGNVLLKVGIPVRHRHGKEKRVDIWQVPAHVFQRGEQDSAFQGDTDVRR